MNERTPDDLIVRVSRAATGSELREAVAACEPRSLVRGLIFAATRSDAECERMCRQSVQHPNGFDCYDFVTCSAAEFGQPSGRLRLHVWWPDETSGDASDIHNHSWDFDSRVLLGRLRFETFETSGSVKSESAESWHRYRYWFGDEYGYRLDYEGLSSVFKTFDGDLIAGTQYWFNHNPLHRVTAYPGVMAASLVVAGPYRTRGSTVLSQVTRKLGDSPVRKFQRDELRRRLIEIGARLD